MENIIREIRSYIETIKNDKTLYEEMNFTDRVLKKVARYWPDEDLRKIMSILDEYGAVSSERCRTRVQLAILKMSEGQRDQLPELVRMAKGDYRDVLAYAEYPEQMRLGFVGMSKLSSDELEAIKRRDRKQYRKWLRK